MTWGVLRVDVQFEIAKVVRFYRLSAGFDVEVCVVLLVSETGNSQDSRDDVLDNITISWLTNTALSGARLYWENKFAYFSVKGVSVPVAVSAFPDELYQCPRNWAESAYPKVIHYNKLAKGGHFAAFEQPKLFSEEVRAGFRSLR